jgi:hypothetical protein
MQDEVEDEGDYKGQEEYVVGWGLDGGRVF